MNDALSPDKEEKGQRRYFPLIILIAIVLFLTPAVLRFVSALTWQADNATVTLANCKTNCELTGTLKRSPWSDGYSLENESGETTHISTESVLMISYPIPKS